MGNLPVRSRGLYKGKKRSAGMGDAANLLI